MDRAAFLTQGKLLVWADPITTRLVQAFQGLLAFLVKDGCVSSGDAAGVPVHSVGGFGQYRGCLIDDPVFGRYVMRLELRANWDEGVTLDLMAFKHQRGTREVSHVELPALARQVLDTLKFDWSALSLDDACQSIETWLSTLVGTDPVRAMASFATPLREKLDAALAP